MTGDPNRMISAAAGADPAAAPVIALVCSAGGLDALARVLRPLPGDLPAAILVLQHLSPDHPSQLVALLSAYTDLPVRAATEGARLRAGQVLVAPPGQHLLIGADQNIILIPSGGLPPYRPSADLLLTTLAIAVGSRLTAVVLSGRGNDAATGVSVVHRLGGTVIASSVASSTQSAMPEASIDRDGSVDHVVDLDAIPGLLVALATVPILTPDEQQPPARRHD